MILHILMVLNVFKLLATVPGHVGSFKSHENAFLNAKNGQNLCIISIIKCKRGQNNIEKSEKQETKEADKSCLRSLEVY